MLATVAAWVTTWETEEDVLPEKLVEPPYSAVRDWVPASKIMLDEVHVPPERMQVPIVVLPFLKVTVPSASTPVTDSLTVAVSMMPVP